MLPNLPNAIPGRLGFKLHWKQSFQRCTLRPFHDFYVTSICFHTKGFFYNSHSKEISLLKKYFYFVFDFNSESGFVQRSGSDRNLCIGKLSPVDLIPNFQNSQSSNIQGMFQIGGKEIQKMSSWHITRPQMLWYDFKWKYLPLKSIHHWSNE